MSNYLAIGNHAENSNAPQFLSKILVYFVTAIMKHLVWPAASNAHPAPIWGEGGAALPPGPPAPVSLPPPPKKNRKSCPV